MLWITMIDNDWHLFDSRKRLFENNLEYLESLKCQMPVLRIK